MLTHPLLLLYKFAFGFLDISLFLKIIEKEDESYSEYNHRYRPELRGRDTGYELSSVISANELEKESEDSVGDEVDAHIMSEIKLQKQEEHYSEENEQERRLIELSRMNGVRQRRELNSEEGVSLDSVAATRKEASDSAEAVRDSDTAGHEREYIDQSAVKPGSCDEINYQEGNDSTDKTAHKGHALSEFEACRRVLDIVIYRLEERCRGKADDDRTYSEKEGEIQEALADSKLFAPEGKRYKGAEYANGDHNTIHIYNAKEYRLW